VTLLAFAADRLAAATPLLLGARRLLQARRAAIDQYYLTAWHPAATCRTLLQWSTDGTDRQTDTVPLHRPCCILCEQCQ